MTVGCKIITVTIPERDIQKSNGEIEMKKSEQKEFAKDILMEAIACAYYKLYDQCDEVPEEEKDEINEYIRKYGEAMATRIGRNYYTL